MSEEQLAAIKARADAPLEGASLRGLAKDMSDLLAYIEELHADLRLHREERIRLRVENYRLSREAK